jgi:very-short-patch-repair endonuclease
MSYKKPSERAIKLCSALKSRLNKHGVECVLEHPTDGHKHVDIRLIEAKIDIEVDGDEHFIDPERFASDVKRRYWSSQEGYVTLHIPNHIIDQKLNDTVEALFQVSLTRKYLLEY